jgi:ribosomal protein L11 methyltransferase
VADWRTARCVGERPDVPRDRARERKMSASPYAPFHVGSRWRLSPPGQSPATDGRLDLVMARGAFGSGEHETTASCLEALETMPGLEGARVLDVGSGTGVLAIAALKLGARHALCLDVDPAAVASAGHNCALNGVADRVQHVVGDLGAVVDTDFDLVLANLYGDLLLRHCAGLVARARVGASLLLSGILWELNWDVRTRFGGAGCTVVSNRFLDAYSTVLLRREGGPAPRR